MRPDFVIELGEERLCLADAAVVLGLSCGPVRLSIVGGFSAEPHAPPPHSGRLALPVATH